MKLKKVNNFQTTYVPEDYEKEKQNENKEKFISLDGFDLPTSVPTRFNVILKLF